ncbi:helix-turn-helix domain-containing protein [uncultured Roseibium sp.]|uniref:GlxA family transcriptional regulator n=1 Tax=uncultured Roseibium sp. TaxID=1936171 RepID=UPI0026266B5C|nr:helix-turn-helix domain-containing protein [uncultured Roseibium sp.]
MPSFSAKSRPVVVIVVFPDTKLLDVTGPMQVFADARRVGGENYEIVLASAEGGAQLTDTGVELVTESMERWHDRDLHTLLIAGGFGAQEAAQDLKLVENTVLLAEQAARVGSVCTGAFVLAASGLLDGRSAVTHWFSCDDLANKHPGVTVEPDRMFIKDGNVWTSAGVTAGIDMALAMVAEDSGRKVAVRLAQTLVVYMVRSGGQSQFSSVLLSQTNDADGRFDALHAWIGDNLKGDLRVDRLAEQVGMSERNFTRVYRDATGRTPAKTIELFRVAAARDLLEVTELPIATIAQRTGFEDDERLRRAMQRVLGISPTEYRKRFGLGKY